jgi:uncharacterized protein DUF4919
MRTAALLLLLLCTAAIPTRAQEDYHALLARAQAGDSTVDFTALRKAWAASPEYAPYGSAADDHADSMRAALERRDWRRTVGEADSVLAVTWLDAATHVMKAYALEELGDSAASTREFVVAARIVRSVEDSGKGTEQTPFQVITVAEEYAWLRMHGFRPESQSLGTCGGRTCDVMEVKDTRSGEKHTFYFDVTIPTEHLRRTLGGAKP